MSPLSVRLPYVYMLYYYSTLTSLVATSSRITMIYTTLRYKMLDVMLVLDISSTYYKYYWSFLLFFFKRTKRKELFLKITNKLLFQVNQNKI